MSENLYSGSGSGLVPTEEVELLRAQCRHLEAKLSELERENASLLSSEQQEAGDTSGVSRREHEELIEQLDALLRSSNEVRYVINADWTELSHLSGGGFIRDTISINAGWLEDYIPLEHRDLVRAEISRAINAKDTYNIEHLVNRADGTVGWALSRAVPLFDEEGKITSWMGAASDITDRKRFEEHQRVLNAELAHRIKNILSMTMAVVSQSLRHAASLEDAAETIGKRITALSNAQTVLTSADFKQADVASIIDEVLSPLLGDVGRIQMDGPIVIISEQAALGLALAIHELATNAVKYGSLSNDTGRVMLHWELGAAGAFKLEWLETGGPPVAPPSRTGFGSRLMNRIAPSYFSGTGECHYDKSGFRYVLSGRVVAN